MQVLVILNGPGEGSDRVATALALTRSLVRAESTQVRLYLAGSVAGRIPEDELVRLVAMGVEVRRPQADPVGTPAAWVVGVEPATMQGLSDWTLEADRVLVF